MKNLAEGIRVLASQMDRLKEIRKSNELCVTISQFPGIMKGVVEFIEKWLESWSGAYSVVWEGLTTESLAAAKHILVLPHKDKAIELRRNLDEFRERFVVDLMVEVQIGQGLVSIFIVRPCLNCDFSHHCQWCFEHSRWAVCDSWSALLTHHSSTRNRPCYASRYWQSSRCVIYGLCSRIIVTHNFAQKMWK